VAVTRLVRSGIALVLALALGALGSAATAATDDFAQLGTSILGHAVGDEWGTSVALDSSGSVLAAGSPSASGSQGRVRVFAWDGSAWVQRGAHLEGEATGDFFGQSVSLSADGSVLAVGAPFNAGGGIDRGHVRVFSWDGSAWVQRGGDIDGLVNGERSGGAVDISADGSRVVIGARLSGTLGTPEGAVRVYQWSGAAWVQLGATISGASGDRLGTAVAISADGAAIIAGGPSASANAGVARVYGWNGTAWTQKGSDIAGAAAGDLLGSAVDIDSSGSTILIGAPRNDAGGSDAGAVSVYSFSGASWNRLGSDTRGLAASAQWGSSVSLSADGRSYVAGAPASSAQQGYAQAYRLVSGEWSAWGSAIVGVAAGDQAGASVAIAGSAPRVAMGAPKHDNPFADAGQVRVFAYPIAQTDEPAAGVAGIALHVLGPVGRQVEGSTVHIAAYRVMPDSTYSLHMQARGSQLGRVLATGRVSPAGHLDQKVLLDRLSPGSYTLTLRGVHASGTGLELVATIRIGPGGAVAAIGENRPGIW